MSLDKVIADALSKDGYSVVNVNVDAKCSSQGFPRDLVSRKPDLFDVHVVCLKAGVTTTGAGNNANKIVLAVVNPVKQATAIKFASGVVGVVHCNGEKFDIEKGVAMAILKALAKEKFDEVMDFLTGLDNKTALKAEKAFAVYWAKKIVGKTQFEATVKNLTNLKEVK